MYSKIYVQNNLQNLYNPYLCWCNNIELSTATKCENKDQMGEI